MTSIAVIARLVFLTVMATKVTMEGDGGGRGRGRSGLWMHAYILNSLAMIVKFLALIVQKPASIVSNDG